MKSSSSGDALAALAGEKRLYRFPSVGKTYSLAYLKAEEDEGNLERIEWPCENRGNASYSGTHRLR